MLQYSYEILERWQLFCDCPLCVIIIPNGWHWLDTHHVKS